VTAGEERPSMTIVASGLIAIIKEKALIEVKRKGN
jgi:hypothetical protein